MNELRENLVAIEKNASADKLRRELTQRLTQATRVHEDFEKELTQLNASIDEKRAELQTLLQDLDLPELPPSSG